MTKYKLFTAVATVALLSGCAGLTSKSTVEELENARATGSVFTQGLAREYTSLARFEQVEMFDYADAELYAQKGLTSARGSLVIPQELAERDLPEDKVGELAGARNRLMSALGHGARDFAPTDAAIAQARFDCWMEQQEENWQVDDIAACRGDFMSAMSAIDGRAAKPATTARPLAPKAPAPFVQMNEGAADKDSMYLVFFDWDKTTLTQGAPQVLDTVASEILRRGENRITIIGHADRSGSDAYNLTLSQKRADATRKGLIDRSVPAERIRTEADGERKPMIDTPDGVREPANRRAEIRFN